MDFPKIFEICVGIEGGYVANRADPGGETKFGISKRAHPGEDISNLNLARAKEIYFKDYWGPMACDALPGYLRLAVFDWGINSGKSVAVEALQKTVGEFEDGIIGPLTLGALASSREAVVLGDYLASRIEYLSHLPTWPAFGRGWARRCAKILRLSSKECR